MSRARPSRLAGLVAVALAVASGLVGISATSAAAALCSGKGVNVVVDFHGLGGGVQKGCDPSGPGKAGNKVFPAAGFALTYAQRQPGFVCRVKGSPSNAPCVNTPPANAYWGLYWSDGKSGKWTYSSSGVGGTKVASGGFLAFSWQNGGANDPPGTAPRNSQPAAPKTPTPTKAPPKGAGGGQGSAGGSTTTKVTRTPKPTRAAAAAATGAARPAASASAQAKAKAQTKAKAKARTKARITAAKASASATRSAASASSAPQPSDDASPDAAKLASSSFKSEDAQDGLPSWIPVTVLVLLIGGSAGVVWWRRRDGKLT